MLISDATASGIKKHYVTTLDRVRDYYGLQMKTMINSLNTIRKEKLDMRHYSEAIDKFIIEFGLLDFRKFRETPVQVASPSP